MLTVDLGKSKLLEFKVSIAGNTQTPSAKLVFPFAENFELSIPAVIKDDIVQVTIPKLKVFHENLRDGNIQLQVIVDGNIFVPWTDTVEFKEQLNVVAEAVVEKTIESKPEVSLKVNLVAENTINEKTGKKQFSRNSIQDEYL